MTTSVLGRVPADEIAGQAREVRFSVVLVTAVIGLFFAIGWLAGRSWLAVVFCAVSVRFGFRQGIGAPPAQHPAAPPPRSSKL